MNNNVPPIRLWCTHFPVIYRDYNAKTHRYKASYVNPASYSLVISAFPQIRYDPNDLEPVKGQLVLPSNTVAFDFSINRIGKKFSKSISKPVKKNIIAHDSDLKNTSMPWAWQVNIPPGAGTYDITVKLRNSSGSGPKNTRRLIIHKDILIVSIGDSAASGQGNPDRPGVPVGFSPHLKWWNWLIAPIALYKITKAAFVAMQQYLKKNIPTAAVALNSTLNMNPKPVWLEKNAYRSLRSGTAIAARRLEETLEGTPVTFLSFARTDSAIQSGLIGPRTDSNGNSVDGWLGNIGQIAEIKKTIGNRQIDHLLITIGINNLGVTSTLQGLVCADASGRSKVLAATQAKLRKFPGEFWNLAQALKQLNVRHTYLIEYPTNLFDKETGRVGSGCEVFSNYWPDLNIDVADAQGIKDILINLNKALKAQAKRFKWVFIGGIANGFKGRGYCTRDDARCFIKVEESMILQGDTQGMVHPNATGHNIIATQILASLQNMVIKDRKLFPKTSLPSGIKLKTGLG